MQVHTYMQRIKASGTWWKIMKIEINSRNLRKVYRNWKKLTTWKNLPKLCTRLRNMGEVNRTWKKLTKLRKSTQNQSEVHRNSIKFTAQGKCEWSEKFTKIATSSRNLGTYF